MNDEWQIAYMPRKRRRSARKSGSKRNRQEQAGITDSVLESDPVIDSISETASVIHEANGLLDPVIEEMMNDNMQGYQGGLPGTNTVPVGQASAGVPASNSYCMFSQQSGLPNNGVSASGPAIQPEQNLQQLGKTSDNATALILQEIQALRTDIKNDIAETCAATVKHQLQIAFGDLASRYDKRFKELEDTVHSLQTENAKLRQDVGNLTIEGGPNGATINNVVESAVEKVLNEKDVLVRPPFDYDRTVAVTGVRWSPSENVQGIAEQVVHEGLNLTDVRRHSVYCLVVALRQGSFLPRRR